MNFKRLTELQTQVKQDPFDMEAVWDAVVLETPLPDVTNEQLARALVLRMYLAGAAPDRARGDL